MKRLMTLLLSFAMGLSLCACGSAPTEEKDENEEPVADTQQQEEQGDDAGTEGENDAEEESSLWELGYYVDEFNQPTEDGYVCNSTVFLGTFSNSATTNSLLYVNILVDKDDISIFLYEYGNNQVKNSSSSYNDEYNIKMRTADGTDHSFTGTMYCGDDRIFIDQAHISEVIDALNQEGNTITSFYIEDAERPVTNYLFSVISNNFAEQYDLLVG